jgi:serine/threonine-protein kinase
VAFKLLTGRMYWREGSLAQLLAQILAEPMPPPSERGSTLGPGFDSWFLRACDRDPDRRFASATEQIEALAAALGLPERMDSAGPSEESLASLPIDPAGSGPSLTSSRDIPAPARGKVSQLWLVGAGLAGCAATLVGLAAVGASTRPPPVPPAIAPLATASAGVAPDVAALATQSGLAALGYRGADGRPLTPTWGPNAVAALMMFQRDHGLPPTGLADAETLRAIGAAWADALAAGKERPATASSKGERR